MQQDPIYRNLTETMGVYMSMDLTSKTPAEGLFDSRRMLLNLAEGREPAGSPGAAEMAGGNIRQDRPRESRGGEGAVRRALRELPQLRVPTRGPSPTSTASASSRSVLSPHTYVGTDPGQFDDLRPYAITGQLSRLSAGAAARQRTLPDGRFYGLLRRRSWQRPWKGSS